MPAKKPAKKTRKITTKKSGAGLSPFIVYLREPLPTPQQFLEKALSLPTINFLQTDLPSSFEEPADLYHNDLALRPGDTHDQFMEEQIFVPPKLFPASFFFTKIKIPHHHPEQLTYSFPLQEFTPPKMPADFMRSLELPTTEEIPETNRRLLRLPPNWKKAMGTFVLLSFVFILPLQAMN